MTLTLPWGEHGVRTKKGESAGELLRRARLDWRVAKKPVFVVVNDKRVVVPKKFALLREDDGSPLSMVSEDWLPTQNEDVLSVFNDVATAMKGTVKYVGSLKSGQIMWGLVGSSLANEYLESYALVTSSHTYGKSMDARYAALLMSDHPSTIVLPLKNALSYSHRSVIETKTIERALEEIREKHDWLTSTASVLSKRAIDNHDRFFAENMRGARPAAAAAMAFRDVFHGKSVWDAVKAASYVIDNTLGYSGDTRLTSAWYGVNRTCKERLLRRAIELS